MKLCFLLFFFLPVLFLQAGCSNDEVSQQSNSNSNTTVQNIDIEPLMSATPSPDHIEVINFHSTHRCKTCKYIEINTKYTLATYFLNEIKTGKITFRTVNVDDESNSMITASFQASGTALFLNIVKKGLEEHIDLTEHAFETGRNVDAFVPILSDHLKLHLQEITSSKS